MFRVVTLLELKQLETIFRYKIFGMLLNKRKFTKERIAMLSTWRHTDVHFFCGNHTFNAISQWFREIKGANSNQRRDFYFGDGHNMWGDRLAG